MLKQIPNMLTIFRLIMIGPFIYFLNHYDYQQALVVYVLAGMTDGLDGWLARRFGWQTRLGQVLDPVADKLLVASSFIALGLLGILPWWLVLMVFCRDLVISCGALAWMFLIDKQFDFPPTRISKLNTFFQLALVSICLFDQAVLTLNAWVIYALIMITAATTSISFVDYVWTWGKKYGDQRS